MITSILDSIVEQKKQEVLDMREPVFHQQVGIERRSFYDALVTPKGPLGIIAEIKKASPSKGILVKSFDPVDIARIYEDIGADAIPVLTDECFFQGHHSFLTEVKKHTSLPVLRKDFIIDAKQIYEAKVIGADAILLIAAILEKKQLREFMSLAEELELDVLMEVHDEEEIKKVFSVVRPKILGVNNRNLKTFETTLDTSRRLSALIPENTLLISESGIRSKQDIDLLQEWKVSGILVGEALMVEDDKKRLIREWFGEIDS